MRLVWGFLGGLVAGLVAIALLFMIGLMRVELCLFCSLPNNQGLWLIPVILLTWPVAGMILASSERGPGSRRVIVAFVLGAAVAPVALRIAEIGLKDRAARVQQERRSSLMESATQAALAAFGSDRAMVLPFSPLNDCGGMLVNVRGEGRDVWFWYVKGRVESQVSAEQMAEVIRPLLPPGADLVMEPADQPGQYARFRVYSEGQSVSGSLVLAVPDCHLHLREVSVGTGEPARTTLDLPVIGGTPEAEQKWQQYRVRVAARSAVRRDLGVSDGQAALGEVRSRTDCPGTIVSVRRDRTRQWYWYDAADDRFGPTVGEAELIQSLNRIVPADSAVTSLVPSSGDAQRVDFYYRGERLPQHGLALFAVDSCDFRLEKALFDGGATWIELNQPIGSAPAGRN